MRTARQRNALCLVLGLMITVAHAEDGNEHAAAVDSATAPPPTLNEPTVTLAERTAVEDVAVAGSVTNEPTGRAIDEIIVTAQKREENLQDVPISISAFSGDALDARGVYQVKDLGQITPAVQFTEFAGYTLIYIRGVGTDAWIPSADPSIATYVDGVYMPTSQGVLQQFGGVQRVEVLKGPQGTLFGRNSTGGAISVVTKRPGLAWETEAEAAVGNFAERRAKIYQSIPLGAGFGLSLTGLYAEIDHQYSNIFYDYDKEKTEAGRIKLGWSLDDDLELGLTAFITRQSGAGGSLVTKNTHPSLLARALSISPQESDYRAEADCRALIDGDHKVLYGDLVWRLAALDVKLIGSTQKINTDDTRFDFEASRMPLVGIRSSGQYTDMQTGELQLISNDGSWNSERLEWVAGIYYLQSKAGYDPALLYAAPDVLSVLETGVVPLPDGVLDLAVPQGLRDLLSELGEQLPVSTPLSETGLIVRLEGLLDTESWSSYLQGTYHFTDWLDLTFGGRYQTERRGTIKSSAAFQPTEDSVIGLTNFRPVSKREDNFSPKLVLSARPTDDSMVYLSWAKGFKSASYNIINIYTPPSYLEPEKVSSFELGAKTDLLDGRLRVNGAVFYNEIKNLQTQFFSIVSAGIAQFENAGSAEIKGAEIDVFALPFIDTNPGLSVFLNAAYLKGEYTDYRHAKGFDETTGVYRENLDSPATASAARPSCRVARASSRPLRLATVRSRSRPMSTTTPVSTTHRRISTSSRKMPTR